MFDSVTAIDTRLNLGETPAASPPKPFKIKDLVNIIFITLASAFALIGAIGLTIGLITAAPVSATLLTISAIGLGVLGLIKTWDFIAPYLPKVLRHVGYTIQTFVTEIFAMIALFSVSCIDLTKKNPKTKEEIDPNETPTLFIHGFLGSSKDWIYHRSRFKAAGYQNLFTINLGNPLISIDTYAKKVAAQVEKIKELTGRNDIRIVSHSMGGVVARQYRYNYAQDTKVKDIITIGPPFKGTYMAYASLGISACGREMMPGSKLLKKQQEQAANDTETDYLNIGSDVDFVILPNSSAFAGNTPHSNTRKVLVETAGHVGLLFSDRVSDLAIDYLKSKDRQIV